MCHRGTQMGPMQMIIATVYAHLNDESSDDYEKDANVNDSCFGVSSCTLPKALLEPCAYRKKALK